MPDSTLTNVTGEQNNVESSTKNDELRIKNVTEINQSTEASTSDNTPAQTKRKKQLPAWMLAANSSNTIHNHTDESDSQAKRLKKANECQLDSEQSNGDTRQADSSEHSNLTNNQAKEVKSTEAANATSSSTVKTESTDGDEAQSTSDLNICDAKAKIKDEPEDVDNTAASTSTGVQNPNDIKPAVKVEKADASSTSRESCKYGIRCYRRNPMHRVEQAHPGDQDYKRPEYPTPPLGTPACPFGNSCYRRNPTHFQLYSHPADTDFQKNYRLRKRRQQQNTAADDDNSDLDDYDLDDPFINDDSDLDYAPSDDDIDDTEELDYDDGDKAEE